MKVLTIASQYEARILEDQPTFMKFEIYDNHLKKSVSAATINSNMSSVWEIEPEAERLHNCHPSEQSEYNLLVRMCHYHALDRFDPRER